MPRFAIFWLLAIQWISGVHMKDEDRTEILAQAIWRGQFGETKILPEWAAFASANQQQAKDMRQQASDMLLSQRDAKKMNGPHNKTHVHTGVDWIDS